MKMAQAIVNDLNACILCAPSQFLSTATVAAGPTQFKTDKTEFRWALVLGQKSLSGTVNTTAVKIGASAAANEQPITINPGDTYVLPLPSGTKSNFQSWYFVTATNDDGIVVIYF